MRKLPQPHAGSKNVVRPELRLKRPEVGGASPVPARLQPREIGAQVVQEQRLDHLQDVLLGRVVRPLRAALLRLHHRLEQRAEDRGRDVRPVEAAGVQQRPAHRRVEGGNAQRPLEQRAVDIGEPGKVLVERLLAPGLGRVENLEQLRQPEPEVGAVLARARLDQVQEDVARLEDARVVGEQAEHDPHQEALQVVAPVARRRQCVVQPPDQLGGLDVGGILIAEGAALHPEDEAERLDMARQVREREGRGLPLVQIVQFERPEVADQDEARALALRQRVEILPACSYAAFRSRPALFCSTSSTPGQNRSMKPERLSSFATCAS